MTRRVPTSPALRFSLSALILLAALLALAACGKKAAPMPPGPPDQVTYPHSYPGY